MSQRSLTYNAAVPPAARHAAAAMAIAMPQGELSGLAVSSGSVRKSESSEIPPTATGATSAHVRVRVFTWGNTLRLFGLTNNAPLVLTKPTLAQVGESAAGR